jgi:hypothetical protein
MADRGAWGQGAQGVLGDRAAARAHQGSRGPADRLLAESAGRGAETHRGARGKLCEMGLERCPGPDPRSPRAFSCHSFPDEPDREVGGTGGLGLSPQPCALLARLAGFRAFFITCLTRWALARLRGFSRNRRWGAPLPPRRARDPHARAPSVLRLHGHVAKPFSTTGAGYARRTRWSSRKALRRRRACDTRFDALARSLQRHAPWSQTSTTTRSPIAATG